MYASRKKAQHLRIELVQLGLGHAGGLDDVAGGPRARAHVRWHDRDD